MVVIPPGRPSLTLGWREWVSLPAFGIPKIKAKLDTGARSSALHVVDAKTFWRDEVEWVRFLADANPRRRDELTAVECRVLDERLIRASSGHEETRIVVRTDLSIGDLTWSIDLTLASRLPMRFRMLLGREALRGRVAIDPARSYLAGLPAELVLDNSEEEEE
ncbi:MAG: RimK/LysX family protein [Gemmatimonadota bacterium]|nr:RimK/LysX family protein [Gemmatimonadota bacterium]